MIAHTWHGPSDHTDPDESDRCQACVLALCKVCGGAEGSLPTECPGVRMTAEQDDAVYAGSLDFKNGNWIKKEK